MLHSFLSVGLIVRDKTLPGAVGAEGHLNRPHGQYHLSRRDNEFLAFGFKLHATLGQSICYSQV